MEQAEPALGTPPPGSQRLDPAGLLRSSCSFPLRRQPGSGWVGEGFPPSAGEAQMDSGLLAAAGAGGAKQPTEERRLCSSPTATSLALRLSNKCFKGACMYLKGGVT